MKGDPARPRDACLVAYPRPCAGGGRGTTRLGSGLLSAKVLRVVETALLAAAVAQPQGLPPEPAPPAATPIAQSNFGEVPWTELAYSAHKLFLGAETVIRAGRLPAETLAQLLPTPPVGQQVLPLGTEAVAVSVTSDLPFGREEAVKVFLDPETGAAMGGEKTMLGRSAYHKYLRYTEAGLYTWRSSPANERESALPPQSWTRRKAYLVAPSVRPSKGTSVSDSYALIYLVTAARLDRRGSELRLVMLADDRYLEMSLASGGLTYSHMSFEEAWPGGSRTRHGDVLVRTVRATARALGATESSEDVELGFLGMRGVLTMYVEVGTGLPVAFSGRVQHVGEVAVRLDRALLKGAPATDFAP
jgi:hypothetical protein